MTFPVKLYHPESKNPDKTLTARNQAELDGLLKIGWKVKEISNATPIEKGE